MLHNIKTAGLPCCPYKLIPGKMHTYQTRNWDNMAAYQCRAETFKSSVIPWTISKWNKIYLAIRYSTYSEFRSHLHKECQPALTLLYIHKSKGDKLLNRLRLGDTGLEKLGFLEHKSPCSKASSGKRTNSGTAVSTRMTSLTWRY